MPPRKKRPTPRTPEPPRRKKSSTLVIATKTPGPCTACRHANQGTVDFAEGKLFCWFAKATKTATQQCDVTLPLRKSTKSTEVETYYLFERYDGDNGTFAESEDLRILAEDADEDLRRSLHADRPFIPGA